MKKPGLLISPLCLLTALGCATAFSADLTSFFPPELIRPAPVTMADLAKRKPEGVSVTETKINNLARLARTTTKTQTTTRTGRP